MVGSGRGGQIIIVDARMPTNLSREQEELLREFARLKWKNETRNTTREDYFQKRNPEIFAIEVP